jgi:hypothetical protein
MCESGGPAPVTQWMHFHPDPIAPLVDLQRARTARHPKVPVVASGSPGQLAFASHHEAAPAALVEDLFAGELEIELEHYCSGRRLYQTDICE